MTAPKPDKHPEHDFLQLVSRLNRVFRPSAPVDDQDLFAGRRRQLDELVEIIFADGQHGIIYGERGVGKTSLAAVCSKVFSAKFISIRVNCDVTDNFATIWGKVVDGLGKLHERGELPEVGNGSAAAIELAAEIFNNPEIGPHEAVRGLERLAKVRPVVLFIDEFDTILDFTVRTLFANTVKALSDHNVPATLIFVGVADTVDDLLAEHESIGRNLIQILMPRMTREELTEIVDRGLGVAGMTAEPISTEVIVTLSQGLPHYTHLLANRAARNALQDQRRVAIASDVRQAVSQAVKGAQQTITTLYVKATYSSSAEHLYEKVLTACALAQTDDLGFFSSADLREPLRKIMGRDNTRVGRHLADLCEIERGPVLQMREVVRVHKYRFLNPMFQPHVLMRGLERGTITYDML